MLTAVVLLSALVAYVFVAGVVHRVLIRLPSELTREVEPLFAGVWPLIPLAYAAFAGASLLNGTVTRIVRLGQRAADLPGRALGQWRDREWRPRRAAGLPRAVVRRKRVVRGEPGPKPHVVG